MERVKTEVSETTGNVAYWTVRVLKAIVATVVLTALAAVVLWGAALGVNALARWNALRLGGAGADRSPETLARENLVVIGVKDEVAIGFVALKAEREAKRVLGLSIPAGAFVEVPGQGYESIGDSYHVSPSVSRDAVSNYLMVPFPHYAVVDGDTFQRLATDQQVAGLLDDVISTDLDEDTKADMKEFFDSVPTKVGEDVTEGVWIVPMPVKPVAVGDERYFEPQIAQIADIVLEWWGTRVDQQEQRLRVIVYNGVGTPGIAGKAAQQLIREGFRVVESRNADRFDYKTTQILLYHGSEADAGRVKEALGSGDILVETAAQDIADIMVIIGADYTPPPEGP